MESWVNEICFEHGIPSTQDGNDYIAFANILTQRSTEGTWGKHAGHEIAIDSSAPEATLPHEMGHALGLHDTWPSVTGGLMDYPPATKLIPSEVDAIWKKANWKK